MKQRGKLIIVVRYFRKDDDGKPRIVLGKDRWSNHEKTDNTEEGEHELPMFLRLQKKLLGGRFCESKAVSLTSRKQLHLKLNKFNDSKN